MKSLIPHTLAAAALAFASTTPLPAEQGVYRVTTISPFPRGLEMIDGDLYVLSRGRVRDSGGVSADVDDLAGTIFRVDPTIGQPVHELAVSNDVRHNGELFAAPTDPPFRLWDATADPPHSDRETDRPYCTLRWHAATFSFYICAYSGVDKPGAAGGRSFSKNLSDAILRYDTRTEKWYEVERHDIEAGGVYPHNDPETDRPPHGWLNGPDNILPLGNWLYAVAKDNSIMVRYDLSAYIDDPEAGPAPSEFILGIELDTTNAGPIVFLGHSGLAWHDDWLYIASRTSSQIIRMRVDAEGNPAVPHEIELVAEFQPWTLGGPRSSDITDIAFDAKGRLYVVNAMPSRVHRFLPDPANIYNGAVGGERPWMDFAAITNNPRMKSENLFIDAEGNFFITSGDGYDYQAGADGTVFRTRIID